MATVFDVAAYILKDKGEMTAMKLQKLVYYAQAWSTVWDDDVLFDEPIEAWANGPVCPALYNEHKGQFKISEMPKGNPAHLSKRQKATIDAVLDFYGKKSAQYLSELTHVERPWMDSREGMAPSERGDTEITPAAMVEYYGGLYKKQKRK